MPTETVRAVNGCAPDPGIFVSWEDGDRTVDLVTGGNSAGFDAAGMDRLIGCLQKARLETFGPPPPTAAVIEIIEPGRATDDTIGGSIIIPAEVRINGHQVLTTGGGERIHQIDLPPREMAQVTLTLPARRVIIAAEGDL